MTLAHATVEELRDAAQREERMDRARRFFAQKVRKTETVYHDELPLTAERTVYERPDGAALVDDLLTLLAGLPALLDRLERAEKKAAAGLSLRQTMWLGAGTERSRTCPAVALRLYDSTLAALDDEAPR